MVAAEGSEASLLSRLAASLLTRMFPVLLGVFFTAAFPLTMRVVCNFARSNPAQVLVKGIPRTSKDPLPSSNNNTSNTSSSNSSSSNSNNSNKDTCKGHPDIPPRVSAGLGAMRPLPT